MNAAFNKFSQVCLRRGEGPDTADPVPGSATRVNQTNDLRFDGHWSCGHFPTACRVGNNRLMMLKQWLICPESVSILTVFLHALSVFFFRVAWVLLCPLTIKCLSTLIPIPTTTNCYGDLTSFECCGVSDTPCGFMLYRYRYDRPGLWWISSDPPHFSSKGF